MKHIWKQNDEYSSEKQWIGEWRKYHSGGTQHNKRQEHNFLFETSKTRHMCEGNIKVDNEVVIKYLWGYELDWIDVVLYYINIAENILFFLISCIYKLR
jgi:hypothetical protein